MIFFTFGICQTFENFIKQNYFIKREKLAKMCILIPNHRKKKKKNLYLMVALTAFYKCISILICVSWEKLTYLNQSSSEYEPEPEPYELYPEYDE